MVTNKLRRLVMNNPYNQNSENNNENTAVNEEATQASEAPKAEAPQSNEEGQSAPNRNTQQNNGYYQNPQSGNPSNAQYTQHTQYSQYTPPYGQQYGAPNNGGYNYGQGQQNPQYGYGNRPYYGYYGNGGYYGQQAPQAPVRSPYLNNAAMSPIQSKSASRSFVIGALAIALAISFILNIIVCASMMSPYEEDGVFQVGNDVIIQYAPKDDSAPVITDKGVSAYVASVASNTVVEVTTETVSTDSYFGQYITQGAGSGVIISTSESGSYILTCAHVIDGAAKVTVKLKDGTTYQADSFICDSESDVGVIKINVKDLPVATVGDFSKVVVGEDVVAIGNPLGTLGGSVTNGIISALNRDIIIDGTTYNLLQTNTEINPGNSGGGLFNANGELIGIVNAKSTGESVEGLGFAIPVDDAVEIMTDLIEKGYVAGRVKLGFELFEIQDQDDVKYWFKYSRYFTDYGVYIASAESSDFREGDLLIAIDSVKIATLTDLKALLQDFEVGQTVTVTVSRIVGNKVQMFDYKLTLTEKTA